MKWKTAVWIRYCPGVLFVLATAPVACFASGPATSKALPPLDGYAVAQHAAIVLERSNASPREAMPLGNGQLGAAVWSADGMTVQLNRADTLPKRLSPGQLVLPGLAKLTGAADYKGRLDLATGEFVETGAGLQATVYIETGTDALVVTVQGVAPGAEETAELRLWAPRQPRVLVRDDMGTLAETWQDIGDTGASGQAFGSLAAIRVDGADVTMAAHGGESVMARFHAHSDGTYQVVVAAPAWRGEDAVGIAAETMQRALAEPAKAHRDWWQRYWAQRATPLAMSSTNGEAQYLGELREIYLYTAAAEVGSQFPGSHAGIGDLFSSMRDVRYWDPSAYWHWNLRMLTAANLSAGVPELNRSYFALYRENLPAIQAWTKQHMGDRVGICVPETMRFNGKGYENETWAAKAAINCGEDSAPFYNARTLSTGAEVAMWIWRQYEQTGDRSFLEANYPVMREQAKFLLAYSKADAAGVLHTAPANAHEDQWDVRDPLTDIVAMQVVFPEVAEAATLLGKDLALVAQLRSAAQHLPALPTVDHAQPHTLLRRADTGASGNAVLTDSYKPGADIHNVENIGLEPVWPYQVIGPETSDPLHALGVRTFETRPNKNDADWSYDPLQAAHLGLADEMRTSLLTLTEKYQVFPSGMAQFISKDFFVEQIGVLTASLDDALVQQSATGEVVIASAWPATWSVDGEVALRHRLRVRVVASEGHVQAVQLRLGTDAQVLVGNPWPGQSVRLTQGTKRRVLRGAAQLVIAVHPVGPAGRMPEAVLLEPVGTPGQGSPVAFPADAAPMHLGVRTIGIERSAPNPVE